MHPLLKLRRILSRHISDRKIRIENSNQNRGPQFNLREVKKKSAWISQDAIQICFHIFKRVQKTHHLFVFTKIGIAQDFLCIFSAQKLLQTLRVHPSRCFPIGSPEPFEQMAAQRTLQAGRLFGRNLERLVH